MTMNYECIVTFMRNLTCLAQILNYNYAQTISIISLKGQGSQVGKTWLFFC